ncbi:MAG: hypothetical protein L0H93_15075 [Nocardioides sp.]|nr:hypothetical protein [Nocardioides sp.]
MRGRAHEEAARCRADRDCSGTVRRSAAAQEWSTPDPAHDHTPPLGGKNYRGAGDISRVDLKHTGKHLVANTVFRKMPYDEVAVFINTRKKRPGPEYVAYATNWGVTLWRTGPRLVFFKKVQCAGIVEKSSKRTWKVRVRRTCIKLPSGKVPPKVHVAVRSSDENVYWTRDWAPSRQKFPPWLHAG